MSRGRMMLSLVAVFCLVLALCSGQDFNCTVIRNGHTTTYIVLDQTRSPENRDSSCHYSWMDANDLKLADDNDKVSSVSEKSLNHLVTSVCFENIFCRQACTSQSLGFLKDFLSNCTTSCTENDLDHGDGKKLTEDEYGKETFWNVHGYKLLIGLIVSGLGVLGVFLLRNKICSFFQCGGLYVLGKTQDTDPNPPVVLEMT